MVHLVATSTAIRCRLCFFFLSADQNGKKENHQWMPLAERKGKPPNWRKYYNTYTYNLTKNSYLEYKKNPYKPIGKERQPRRKIGKGLSRYFTKESSQVVNKHENKYENGFKLICASGKCKL